MSPFSCRHIYIKYSAVIIELVDTVGKGSAPMQASTNDG